MVHKVQVLRGNLGQTSRILLVSAATVSLLGACSADISRFNFNDQQTTTGALPSTTPPESVYDSPSGLGKSAGQQNFDQVDRSKLAAPTDYDRPSRYDTSRVEVKPVAPAEPTYGRELAPAAPSRPSYAAPAQPKVLNASPAPSLAANAGTSAAQSIFVRRGDTLYGLSRRHGTTVTALMRANNLSSSNLKPGQKLYLPAGADTRAAAPTAAPVASQAPVISAEAPAHWTDSYTIQSGDSLYRLSRRYNVKIADLKRYNNIRNPRALKPGMVLKVPGPGGDNGTFAARTPNTSVTTRRVKSRPIAGSPTILNGGGATTTGPAQETKVAAVNPATRTDARQSGQSLTVKPETGTRKSIAGTTKLRWPVRGRIISGFGKRNDGTHNDGINVAVPLGTNIHAAESGMVAYAGDELKGYGNLVLIRHDNGWVTAYAHAEKLLVKRGDRIRRGDVIAKAGKTGDVAQPQVHFEVRQGQKPVDPVPFMDRL